MAMIRVSKIEAVGRDTDAAIRLTFAGEDPVTVHAIAAEAHRLMLDFYRSRGENESYLRLGDWIAPQHAARFWRYLSASAEFLKPGDWGSTAILELDEDANDFLIVFAERWYQQMGGEATRDMRVFATWYVACNPGILRPDALPEAQLNEQMQAMSKALQSLSRADRLRAGQLALTTVAKPAA